MLHHILIHILVLWSTPSQCLCVVTPISSSSVDWDAVTRLFVTALSINLSMRQKIIIEYWIMMNYTFIDHKHGTIVLYKTLQLSLKHKMVYFVCILSRSLSYAMGFHPKSFNSVSCTRMGNKNFNRLVLVKCGINSSMLGSCEMAAEMPLRWDCAADRAPFSRHRSAAHRRNNPQLTNWLTEKLANQHFTNHFYKCASNAIDSCLGLINSVATARPTRRVTSGRYFSLPNKLCTRLSLANM